MCSLFQYEEFLIEHMDSYYIDLIGQDKDPAEKELFSFSLIVIKRPFLH